MSLSWPWRGAAATLADSGLFDPDFYRRNSGLVDLDRDGALRHYLSLGAAQGLQPHPRFDPAFYLGQTSSRGAKSNPLQHYLRHGSRRGLRPSALFDPGHYAQTNPDVRLRGWEPLSHFATRGWHEGREPTACAKPLQIPLEPSEEEWRALPPRPTGAGQIDIVIPVFAGRTETLRTIHRVLAAVNARPFDVVVVDDASPDEAVASRLEILARTGHITLLRNAANLGFVASANRGLALHPWRDVVLLNADTEVHGNWIDRLTAVAGQHAKIGTVTPWSNNATILSYPVQLRDNPATLEQPDDRLDRIAAALPLDGPVEIPTAVGFCMYVKRSCLSAVGVFDETRFGRGYGEENDFSRRARQRGWLNVAATSVFVRHHGSRSFGAERHAMIERGLAAMEQIHPGYLRAVRAFNRADPLRSCRQSFDEARVRASAPTNTLSDGAGPAPEDAGASGGTITVTPAAGPDAGLIDLHSLRVPIAPNLPPLDPAGPASTWIDRLRALGVTRLHTSGHDRRLAAFLEAVSRASGLPLHVTSRADRDGASPPGQ